MTEMYVKGMAFGIMGTLVLVCFIAAIFKIVQERDKEKRRDQSDLREALGARATKYEVNEAIRLATEGVTRRLESYVHARNEMDERSETHVTQMHARMDQVEARVCVHANRMDDITATIAGLRSEAYRIFEDVDERIANISEKIEFAFRKTEDRNVQIGALVERIDNEHLDRAAALNHVSLEIAAIQKRTNDAIENEKEFREETGVRMADFNVRLRDLAQDHDALVDDLDPKLTAISDASDRIYEMVEFVKGEVNKGITAERDYRTEVNGAVDKLTAKINQIQQEQCESGNGTELRKFAEEVAAKLDAGLRSGEYFRSDTNESISHINTRLDTMANEHDAQIAKMIVDIEALEKVNNDPRDVTDLRDIEARLDKHGDILRAMQDVARGARSDPEASVDDHRG